MSDQSQKDAISPPRLPSRPFPALGRSVSCISWGSFKIGRNTRTKYPTPFELPDESESARMIDSVLAMGVTLLDTAPAYGLAESRIGCGLGQRRGAIVLATKVGELFADGVSTYDFSGAATTRSLHHSRERLQTERLDLVCIHADGSDEAIIRDGSCLAALDAARQEGHVGCLGLSATTLNGARLALQDPRIGALMVEYNPSATGMSALFDEAARRGVAVLVKKALGSGRIAPEEAIPFCLAHPAVTSVVIGTKTPSHLAASCALASRCGGGSA